MNIVLIGFMGSGKSSVAALLSKKLNKELIEMDDLVLQKSGRSTINEIFEKDGEIVFRNLEIDAAHSLQDKNNCVISTGGGAVQSKIIIDCLKKSGKIFYLSASFAEIEKRLAGNSGRPLFKNKEKALELYSSRKSLYDKYADAKILTGGKTIDQIADEIIASLRIQKTI